MAPEDIPKTTVVTPVGYFSYNVMNYGWKNAASTFQRKTPRTRYNNNHNNNNRSSFNKRNNHKELPHLVLVGLTNLRIERTMSIFNIIAICMYFTVFASSLPFKTALPTPTVTVNLCYPNRPKGEYFIQPAGICERQTAKTVKQCVTTVHELSNSYKNITLYVCQKSVTKWSSKYFFFGASSSKMTSSMIEPPTPLYCQDWTHTLIADNIGDLKPTSGNSWSTDNKAKITYSWPSSKTGEVVNAHLTRVQVSYDPFNRVMIGAFPSISTCNILTGSCTLGTQTLIWKHDPLIDCPNYQTTHTLLNVHYNSSNEVYRLEFPRLGQSIHNFGICGPSLKKCFDTDTFCTNNGLLFQTRQCMALNGSSFIKVKHPQLNYRLLTSNFSKSSYLVGFVQENSDKMAEVIEHLTNDINYLECQIESILTSNIKLLSNQYPGKILSHLLGGKRAAITVGDILTEIECQRVNVTVLRSLYLQNKYATRPLVYFIDSNNETVVAQIFPDSNAYVGIHFFELYTPGRIFTFQIDGRFYNYVNYTLNHANTHVNFLNPTFKPIVDQFKPIDYTKAYNDLPNGHLGENDMNNILLSLSHMNRIKERILRGQPLSSDDDNSETDTRVISDKMKDTFVKSLDFINSSILSAVYMLLFHLSLIWATVWTFCFIKRLIPRVRDEAIPQLRRFRQYVASRRVRINIDDPPRRNNRDEHDAIYTARPQADNGLNLYPILTE